MQHMNEEHVVAKWFDRVIGADSNRAAAIKADLDQKTLARVRTGANTKAEHVISLARAYNVPTVRALVDTGFLYPEEAVTSNMRSTLSDASDANLANEILRRLENGQAGPALTD